ncbi:MAG: SDR family oxidoreductase [Clostridiales bacterium]|nr:SDR family oxidoreductase [Clostridiales bacterium]
MKTVLITGATGGIGQALAKTFSKNGFNVVMNYNNNYEKAKELLKEVNGIIIKADVSSEKEVEEMFAIAREKYGKIDVLINNSAIQSIGMLCDQDANDWQKVIDVDLTGAYNTVKCALYDMMYQGGKIINISSIWGQCGASCEVAYSTAKAGLIGFTKALAKEYPNINTNCICPGVIDTEMNGHLSIDLKEELEKEIPMNRFGTPEEVAELALFLAQKGDYILGQVIAINGGMYM